MTPKQTIRTYIDVISCPMKPADNKRCKRCCEIDESGRQNCDGHFDHSDISVSVCTREFISVITTPWGPSLFGGCGDFPLGTTSRDG